MPQLLIGEQRDSAAVATAGDSEIPRCGHDVGRPAGTALLADFNGHRARNRDDRFDSLFIVPAEMDEVFGKQFRGKHGES